MQDEDVTKLTDEELDAKLGEQPEETDKEEATPVEAETSEEESEEEQPKLKEDEKQEESEELEAEKPKEEEPKLSRRQELAIQKILGNRTPRTSRPQPSQPNALDYSKELDADPEVIKRLDDDRQAVGDSRYNQGLEQAKSIQFHTRLEIDAPRVEGKYAFLDKSNENFDPVRANAMNSLYLDSVGYDPGDPQRGIPESVQNPNIRYADFVEAQMEFAEALMSDRQAETVKNVTKQAAQTGLRPDGSSAKPLNLNKDPEAMTDEELDTYLTRSGLGTKKRQI